MKNCGERRLKQRKFIKNEAGSRDKGRTERRGRKGRTIRNSIMQAVRWNRE